VTNDSYPAVTIERVVPAPPKAVFEAWLDPEALRRFMWPEPGARVTRAESDARVGGKFLVVMHVGGRDLPHHGEYLEIERYTRLVFTWRSHLAGEGSRVTLRFTEAPGGHTKLTLVHTGLPDPEVRDMHHGGWSSILSELAAWEWVARD
jgi:uncharacterized protein YndB with AHSA1/START domain